MLQTMASVLTQPDWQSKLSNEFRQPYMTELAHYLAQRSAAGAQIYPALANWFAALNHTPPQAVKAVILGQDPYHGPHEAHGLSFSVQAGTKTPSSLRNIFKELQADLGQIPPLAGDLTPWAQAGVLLLNTVLTVEDDRANAHKGRGWERFTDTVIDVLNRDHQHIVFILWGAHAQKKAQRIDLSRHAVITSAHPSGLSAHRGFFSSRPFSRANSYLISQGRAPIDWCLPVPRT